MKRRWRWLLIGLCVKLLMLAALLHFGLGPGVMEQLVGKLLSGR